MPKTQPSTLSADGVLHLSCPRSWKEMTQEQLRYALHVIGCGMYSSVEGRTLMLLRFTGIEVKKNTPYGWACCIPVGKPTGTRARRHFFFLQSWQVQDMIRQLEYVDSYDDAGVRLESIRGFKAVDVLLRGVPFYFYLYAERYYQLYLKEKKQKFADKMAGALYLSEQIDSKTGLQKMPELSLDVAETTACIMWFSYVKKAFSRYFPHFFKPVSGASASMNLQAQTDAQIRALTDGDITKEQQVYNADTWRALTELDAKAREAEEFRKKYPSK